MNPVKAGVRTLARSWRNWAFRSERGRGVAQELLDARDAALAGALADLSGDERDTLADLLSRLLTSLYAEAGDAELMCRLCDRQACVTGAPCPVGAAERAARASRSPGSPVG